MPFKALLGELLARVPGARGAILADWEGEAVDQVARMDSYQLKVLGAHKGIILQNLRTAVAATADELRELVVTTEQSQTLVLPINEDYFLVLALDKGDALGRALFEARRCVCRLQAEIT